MAAQPVVVKASKEFLIPPDEGLSALVPGRMVDFRGQHVMAYPHNTETTRLARNMGYKIPAPVLSQYQWPSDPPPFETQKTTAALLTMQPRAYVLSEMGTGKTRAALYACDHMFNENQIEKVLVVAPLSTLTQVWDKEIFRYFMHLTTVVLHHPIRKKRLALLRDSRKQGGHAGVEHMPGFDARLVAGLDGLGGAFGLAYAAVDALVRIDHQHVLAFVEAVDRTHGDAVHVLAADAAVGDEISHAPDPSLIAANLAEARHLVGQLVALSHGPFPAPAISPLE